MKNTNLVRFILALATVSVLFTGCKREDKEEDTGTAVGFSLVENTFNDAGNIAMQSFEGDLASYKNSESLAGPCATLTNNTSTHVIEINFGITNCLCNDGRNRRGSIFVNYMGAYRDSGSTHTITFSNYFVNDNQVQGTKTVSNTGRNTGGNLVFSIVENGSVTQPGGGTITRSSNRFREWFAGESTPIWNDDIYLLTGNANGTNADGDAFTSSITTALRKEIGCRNVVSGVLEFTPASRPTRTIDFGNGTCDNTATVTVNGRSRTITLP